MNTLYISYDGLLEPLGQSQVVSYLVGLSSAYRQTVLSFEKPQDLQQPKKVRELDDTLRKAGIRWIRRRYHKWPPVLSTFWDALAGILAGLSVCLAGRIHVVHARGYVPSLIALVLRRVSGAKYLFDMRGFWADEKVDGGHWSRESRTYATTKRCERSFYETADAIVSLTQDGVKAIRDLGYRIPAGTPVRVIPTCTDLEKFSPGPRDHLLLERFRLTGHRVIGCVGTMSNWYLRRPMLEYLGFLTRRLGDAKILIVTREDHDQLRADAVNAGVPTDRLVLAQADFSAMPLYMRLMDLGMFFIKACFSKRGSAATKLGEFLACGVPVVINDGIGDSGWIVRRHRVGVVLPDVAEQGFEASFQSVLDILKDRGTAERCRATAKRYFDLGEGVRAYAALYRELDCAPTMEHRVT
jgi:glycosyltransferase involved in cell wall biosynthesis